MPSFRYVNDGFCSAESTVPSFSKSHSHAIGWLFGVNDEYDWSVNCTASGSVPLVGVAENAGNRPFAGV